MRKIFISVGMNGRTFEDVSADLKRAEEWIFENIFEPGCEDVTVVDNLDCSTPVGGSRLWCLGEAIKKLGECDTCFFVKGWEKYKGCLVEMDICNLYGIEIIEE